MQIIVDITFRRLAF